MKFNLKAMKGSGSWRWLCLCVIWLLVPGGTLIVLTWLYVREVLTDKDSPAYYDGSFGEFMKRRRNRKEAEHDVHAISNQ